VGAAAPGLTLRVDTLGRTQGAVLKTLAPFTRDQGFYLGGGTALALQLGHRRSVDFDWFREKPLAEPLRLASEIAAAGIPFRPSRAEAGTLHGMSRRVRVSFLEYRYPLLRPGLDEGGIVLASLEDLAAMKLAAVAQRGARRDFVDVFALGQHFRLEEMLAFYRAKYGLKDWGHVLVALSYFDGADREAMPVMLERWAWRSIKAAIAGWVRKAAGG
jgi:hypothetical protein